MLTNVVLGHVSDLATENLKSPVRRRLSSFFSLSRRNSTSSSVVDHRLSCASLNSLGNQGGSPASMVTSPTSKFGGKRQKGMAGLIRASRNSTKQSSIIRQNGDIIIIKGGKIVSIRRQPGTDGTQDSSPLIKRSFLVGSNGMGGAASNGHAAGVGGGILGDTNTTDVSKAVLPHRDSLLSSEDSDSVFDDSSSNVVASTDPFAESPLEIIDEERRLLSQQSEMDQVVESSVDTQDAVQHDSAEAAAAVGAATDSSSEEENNSADRRLRTGVGIIINIDEDNSILNVAPLTPQTRDRITRSDLFLGGDSGAALVVPTRMKVSRSMQGLSKRSLHRLPSVEFLDPPVSLMRSSSDFNVHQGSKSGNFLQPAPPGRRWSFGKRT